MVLIPRLVDQVARTNVIDVRRAIFRPAYEISVAIGNWKADLHGAILVMASEFTNVVTNTEIPQLDSAISASSQECIERIIVSERPLIKFDCVRMPLVAIINRA